MSVSVDVFLSDFGGIEIGAIIYCQLRSCYYYNKLTYLFTYYIIDHNVIIADGFLGDCL